MTRVIKGSFLVVLGVGLVVGILVFAGIELQKSKVSDRIEEISQEQQSKLSHIIERVDLSSVDHSAEMIRWMSTRGEDAGDYLNPRVNWDATDFETQKHIKEFFKNKDHRNELMLPAEAVNWAKSAIESNFSDLEPFEGNKISTDWMADLKSFGYWDIFKNSPNRYLNPFSIATYVMPNMNQLLDWATYRYVEGIVRGEYEKAVYEIRNLSRLLYAQETFVGLIVSHRILYLENSWYARCQNSRVLNNCSIEPVSLDDLNLTRKLQYAQFLMLKWPNIETHYPKLLNHKTYGVCNAVSELMIDAYLLRATLSKRYPGKLTAWKEVIKKIRPQCKTSFLDLAWKDGGISDEERAFFGMGRNHAQGRMVALPWQSFLAKVVPEYIGLTLLSVADVDYSRYFQSLSLN